MEPKKKRGRPVGSINKPKAPKKEILVVKGISSGPLGTLVEYEDGDIKLQDNNGNDLTPKLKLPSNWDTMGKIERLKWLTANKK